MSQLSPLLAVWSSINLEASEDAAAENIKDKVLPLLHVGGDGAGEPITSSTVLKKADIEEILTNTEPKSATALWIVALNSRYAAIERFEPTQMFSLVEKLLADYTAAQAKLVPEAFATLVQTIAAASNIIKKPVLSLKPLLDAALGFSILHNTLSPAHALLVEQSLRSKSYDHALTLLQYPLTTFDGKLGVTYRDHLKYHYYGAQILIALHDYARAREFLAIVYCAPAMSYVASALQVAAYKKLILLDLVIHGKRGLKPKVVSDYVDSVSRTIAQPYEFLRSAFENGDAEILGYVWGQVNSYIEKDGNETLAVEVLTAFRKHKIRSLRKTFITVPLTYVAERDLDIIGAGPDTRTLIFEMIENGELSASLSQNTADNSVILRFIDSPLTDRDLDGLQETLDSVRQINEQIALADRRVGMSREYLTLKSQGPVAGYSAHMGTEFDVVADDEYFGSKSGGEGGSRDFSRRMDVGTRLRGLGAGQMEVEGFNRSDSLLGDDDESD
ncbi:uncharacterized protein V2V93DRAFT_370786 [Kockiozyma suomiensis]|uniref:uncharacterized protein n=1 Tax=Kockiozyma suomiensis TaxID=1337062 RepID=UPI003342ECCA